jgi:hypothetical protein
MGIWINLRQFNQQDHKHRIDEYLATTGIKPSRIRRQLPVQRQKKQRLGTPWWKLWWYLKQLVSNTCFPDINRGLWMQLVPCWILFCIGAWRVAISVKSEDGKEGNKLSSRLQSLHSINYNRWAAASGSSTDPVMSPIQIRNIVPKIHVLWGSHGPPERLTVQNHKIYHKHIHKCLLTQNFDEMKQT